VTGVTTNSGHVSGRSRGYVETGLAALINGSIGVMVSYATAPASMLLVLRMSFAALALGTVFVLRRGWRDVLRPGVRLKVLGISIAVAGNLILYFLAIRYTGVAIAIFLSYLAPVYLAFVAPRIFHESTERIVYVALVVGVAGMVLILVPDLTGGGAHLSAAGLLYAIGAGLMYAVYLLFAKTLRNNHVSSTSIVCVQSAFTAVVLLPLALAQTVGHYSLTSRDLLMGALLGVLTTAISFSLFMDGMRYIRVQHASIMGYIEPVSAPFYALLFLSQVPSGWTLAGGALIIAAGVLVIVFGKDDDELGAPRPGAVAEVAATATPGAAADGAVAAPATPPAPPAVAAVAGAVSTAAAGTTPESGA
jgi:drug/metabolite transporter (DMT)-like permease